jgi:hypothetical protein
MTSADREESSGYPSRPWMGEHDLFWLFFGLVHTRMLLACDPHVARACGNHTIVELI